MWFAGYNPMDVSVEYLLAEEGVHVVVKQGFEIILLDGGHRCSAVCQLNAGGGYEWTACPPRVTQDIR